MLPATSSVHPIRTCHVSQQIFAITMHTSAAPFKLHHSHMSAISATAMLASVVLLATSITTSASATLASAATLVSRQQLLPHHQPFDQNRSLQASQRMIWSALTSFAARVLFPAPDRGKARYGAATVRRPMAPWRA